MSVLFAFARDLEKQAVALSPKALQSVTRQAVTAGSGAWRAPKLVGSVRAKPPKPPMSEKGVPKNLIDKNVPVVPSAQGSMMPAPAVAPSASRVKASGGIK